MRVIELDPIALLRDASNSRGSLNLDMQKKFQQQWTVANTLDVCIEPNARQGQILARFTGRQNKEHTP
jgi:hypothetical protein